MGFLRRRSPPAPRQTDGTGPTIDAGSSTAVGGRADNQDRCAAAAGLAVVSDGMGGHRGGARAAELSVEAVLAVLGAPSADDPETDPHRRLRGAFAAASSSVRAERAADPSVREMGATLTVGLLAGGSADRSRWLVGHVGDSPAFVVSPSSTTAVTTDHNRAAALVAAGVLSEAQAATHPGRHILLRAIGPDARVEVDVAEVELHDGDALVLCSDGASGTLAADELGSLVRSAPTAADAAAAVVAAAVARGATDNVTAVVVRQVASSAP